MTESTDRPTAGDDDLERTAEWRPYGYTDAGTGTTEAAGAQLRTGPATTPASGSVLPAGQDAGPTDPAAGEDANAAVPLPAVLVPDTAETREAEQHRNVAPPAAGDAAGTEGAPDLGTGNEAGAEDSPGLGAGTSPEAEAEDDEQRPAGDA